jgi:hypothetical protein
MICRKYSFQKLTQFSKEKNVLDVADSSIPGFLCRAKCVPSAQLNKPITTGKHCSLKKYSFPKLTQFSLLKKCAIVQNSNTNGFLTRDTCF